MATRQITLDKFGSETSPVKEKVPPKAMPSSTGKQSHYGFLLRSVSRFRQVTAPAESASRPWEKSDGSTHVPVRSDGR